MWRTELAAWHPGNLSATSTTVSYVMLGHLMLKYEDTDTSSLSQQAGFLLATPFPPLRLTKMPGN